MGIDNSTDSCEFTEHFINHLRDDNTARKWISKTEGNTKKLEGIFEVHNRSYETINRFQFEPMSDRTDHNYCFSMTHHAGQSRC